MRHRVAYLGALPLEAGKASSLANLQLPLKDLYFKYLALQELGQLQRPGTLDITPTGLTLRWANDVKWQ